MFETLSEKLNNAFKNITKKGVLTERDIEKSLKEIRLVLLEADVNFKVVKDFCNRIKEKSAGEKVMKSLNPGQQLVKIVNEEIIELLGGQTSEIQISGNPAVVMIVGLQGSGKTTACAKLAVFLKKKGRNSLLVGADTYRPAAIEQLHTLANEVNIDFYSQDKNPIKICSDSLKDAKEKGDDTVIIDTAGRLHIDEEMLNELVSIKKGVKPHHILLVVDAMTGQEAVNVAKDFKEKVGIDGIIMTKLDGDARGGAALSVKSVTGVPILFAGVGEKTDKLDVFHPDRMASRILGMGDVLTLIEKTEEKVDAQKTKELQERIKKQSFTLDDLLAQMKDMKKMGSIDEIMAMIPGANKIPKELIADEKEIAKMEAIILSMTQNERQNPSIINGSRRKRIALGSGTSLQAVNRLLKQHAQSKKLLANLSKNKSKLSFGKGFPFQL